MSRWAIHRRLYDWLLSLAHKRYAGAALFAVSFAESSVFPIPPDVMLVPMCMRRPQRAWGYATNCTVASVLGGLLGYAIGYFFFEPVAQPILSAYGHPDALGTFRGWFERWGMAVILIKGLTPIPFKIVTIAAGAAGFDLWNFVLACVVTRGFRFFSEAWLAWWFGERAERVIDRYFNRVCLAALLLIVFGFVAIKLFRGV